MKALVSLLFVSTVSASWLGHAVQGRAAVSEAAHSRENVNSPQRPRIVGKKKASQTTKRQVASFSQPRLGPVGKGASSPSVPIQDRPKRHQSDSDVLHLQPQEQQQPPTKDSEEVRLVVGSPMEAPKGYSSYRTFLLTTEERQQPVPGFARAWESQRLPEQSSVPKLYTMPENGTPKPSAPTARNVSHSQPISIPPRTSSPITVGMHDMDDGPEGEKLVTAPVPTKVFSHVSPGVMTFQESMSTPSTKLPSPQCSPSFSSSRDSFDGPGSGDEFDLESEDGIFQTDEEIIAAAQAAKSKKK